MTSRVLISIDTALLERIDAACRARGLTRSRYLAQLADQDLVGGRGPGAEPSVKRALKDIDVLFGER